MCQVVRQGHRSCQKPPDLEADGGGVAPWCLRGGRCSGKRWPQQGVQGGGRCSTAACEPADAQRYYSPECFR